MGHGQDSAVKNPGNYQISSGMRNLLMAFVLIGAGTFAAGMMVDAKRVWFSFLQNHFYFMSLALGGAFFAAVQWISGAMWSAPVRRLAESFTSYIPVAIVSFVVLFFGLKHLYIWTDAATMHGNLILEGKIGYLNVPFFMIRNIVVLLILLFFTKKMVGNSIAQDSNKAFSFTLKNRTLSPGFLILFSVGFTIASFDLLMSLDPTWFSTMFGVYCFAGLFYSILAATTLLTIFLYNRGALSGVVNENHLHDLGKFMFSFSVFWAYIGFSQFMLIWYANLPEETGYFITRLSGGWLPFSVVVLLGKFLLPFFLLMPREAKRCPKNLARVAWIMLIFQWLDILWLSQPEFSKSGPMISWIELLMPLGFIGVLGLCISRFLSKYNIVAIGDPRLAESVHHHHQ